MRFPVTPLPPSDDRQLKTPVIAVRTTGLWHVYTLLDIGARVDAAGTWDTSLDGIALRFEYRSDPDAVWVRAADAARFDVIYTFWFAWYAMHPIAE